MRRIGRVVPRPRDEIVVERRDFIRVAGIDGGDDAAQERGPPGDASGGADLRVESGEDQRMIGPLRVAISEQRKHFVRRPDGEDRSRQHVTAAGGRVGGEALVDGALERDHVEPHLFVEEPDQPVLCQIEFRNAVAALAKLHEAPIADDIFQKLKVRKVVVRSRVD
jgi:hypothetical protein